MTKLTREFSFSTGGTSGLLMPYPFMLILKTQGSAFYRPPMGINKLQSARLDFWIQPHRIWAFIMRNKIFGSVGCAAWLCRIANAHIQSGRISKSDRAGVADTEQVQRKMRCRRVCQWAKVNGRNFALVEYQDQTPASARMVPRALQRCSVAVQKHTRCRSVIHLNRRSGNENKSRFILHFARFSLSLYPKTSRERIGHPSTSNQ